MNWACGGWRSRTLSTRSSESAVPAPRAIQLPCFHPAGFLVLALWLAALPLVARTAGAEGTESPPEAPPHPQLPFPGRPALQASVGSAHQLALENLLVLNTIRDQKHDHNRSGLFRDPRGTFIRAGGDYQTPWTRDASINSWNANSLLAPAVAAKTLWAVVERQNGRLIVQQDNQWWDQIIWIPTAWNHCLVTGDRAFLAPAYEAATQTLARRREKNFNAVFGLFGGPSFFNDGIAGYPPLEGFDIKGSFVLGHPGTDQIMALSTNCVYVEAYRAAANLARELARPPEEAADFDGKAALAAATVDATGILADEIIGQANLALASKDFREIYNAMTEAVDGGWQNGDHWGSAMHQTWSASSFLRAVHLGVFGLGFERDGLRFAPHLPDGWSGVTLTDLPYRGGILDLTLTGGGSTVAGVRLDGKVVKDAFLPAACLSGRRRVEIALTP